MFLSVRTMKRFLAGGLALLAAGCSTTPKEEVQQFDPIPVAEIRLQELDPVDPKKASELLEQANAEFLAANAAQERGDNLEAYQHYTQMMELLLESDLDPTVFYNLRNEFGSILGTSTKLAKTYERTQPPAWSQEVVDLAFRSELDFPNPLNDRVLAEIRAIQTVYPQSYQAGLDRSYKYLPYIREEFKKAGLPQDLVWLAMVESQFTPRINSHAGAGGMWQFMKSTGRRYGLSSDVYYVDDRYDWKKSTQAAIQYLSELYEMFDGSWPLAVSAYNMGEAGLERAIASNGGERDLWTLIERPPASNRIRRETKRFYSKLLASAIVAHDPEKYGFKRNPGEEERTTYTSVKGFYSMQQIEQEAGLSKGTLAKLNPQFVRGYTPPGRTVQLYVPLDSRMQIAAAVERVPELKPGTHTVQRGETLSGIAGLYRVTARELQSVNNIRSARRLQIGQRLVIPGGANTPREQVATSTGEGRLVYRVSRGDTLSVIAERYRVSVRDVQAWNNLGRSTRIHIGDRMFVSAGKPVTTQTEMGTAVLYTVRAGDYPARIARNYNVALNDFLAWNGLNARSTIRAGEKLKIYGVTAPSNVYAAKPRKPASTTSESPAAVAGAKTHVVRNGENPWTIAKKHSINSSDLLAWNGMTKRSVLQVGDVLYVAQPTAIGDGATTAIKVQPAVVKTPKQSAEPLRLVHSVRRGQNPWTIAKKYNVSVNDLRKWNGWSKDPVLQIGDEIIIIQAKSTD